MTRYSDLGQLSHAGSQDTNLSWWGHIRFLFYCVITI